MRPKELETVIEYDAEYPDQIWRDDSQESMGTAPGEAPEIVRRLKTWLKLLEACEEYERMLQSAEQQLTTWAAESRVGGWSTHQVKGNLALAADCRVPLVRHHSILAKCKEATDVQA